LSAAHAVEVSKSGFSSHLEVVGHWTAVAESKCVRNVSDVSGKIGGRVRQDLLRAAGRRDRPPNHEKAAPALPTPRSRRVQSWLAKPVL
jgi:hypothetical protein